MKKLLIYLSLFAVLLCGCQPRSYPEIKGHIWWFDFEQRNAIHDEGDVSPFLRAPDYEETDRLDDPKLQSAVQDIRVDYPLDTEEKVTAYAWELYDICVELGYFDEIWQPCDISCYCDGIIDISYLDPQYIGYYYDGYAPSLYVSALDGHIIARTSNDA